MTLKSLTSFAAVAAMAMAASAFVAPAFAADEEAGVPLAPSDAGGAWSVETGGHTVCVIKLSASRNAAGGYAMQAPAECQGTLPAVSGWTPTRDGLGLTGADGQTLIRFNRWSNSLFVSHASSGADVQLRRGGA